MKNEDIRELSLTELNEKIEQEQLLLLKQRMNHAVSPLDNPLEIKKTRRLIARLKTELSRRRINGEA